VVRAYLAGHFEVVTERLPGDAPETNPDESVWGHSNHGRLNPDQVETRSFRSGGVRIGSGG
jgi:hypothetical protein